ncbi:MAG: hypothetical protein Kow0088_15130 [Anaerolineales bacterium]
MSLTLSTIICTKDRSEDLKQCITSILKGKRVPDEIVIIDDGNLDPQLIQSMLKETDIRIEYRKKSPPNINASRNLATSIATGDILSFLDDDVILDQGYYLAVMNAFEKDYAQKIAGITGALIIDTHPVKRVFLKFFGLESNQPGKVHPSGAVTLVRAGEIVQPIKVDWLSGCNMNFRRWIFQEYRFSEQDSGYIWGDDRDFTFPIGQKYLLIALPDAMLIHKKSPVSRSSAFDLGRMEIFHLGRFFATYSSQNLMSWFALYWAFIGIMIKNILSTFHPNKRLKGFKQALGNLKGLIQFFEYLKIRK